MCAFTVIRFSPTVVNNKTSKLLSDIMLLYSLFDNYMCYSIQRLQSQERLQTESKHRVSEGLFIVFVSFVCYHSVFLHDCVFRYLFVLYSRFPAVMLCLSVCKHCIHSPSLNHNSWAMIHELTHTKNRKHTKKSKQNTTKTKQTTKQLCRVAWLSSVCVMSGKTTTKNTNHNNTKTKPKPNHNKNNTHTCVYCFFCFFFCLV